MLAKLLSPITIIILILLSSLFIPRHYARNDTNLYQACRNMSFFPCGKPISGVVDYPFWVTHSDCGLEEFKLSCDHEDLVLEMGSYNKYRVAAIYPLKGLLTLYHYDILESICESIDSHVPVTKFNDTLYDHSPNTGFLDLYYDCRDAIDTTGNMSDLTCSNGVTDRVYTYQKNPVTPVELEMLKSCSHTVLPVNLSVLEDFIKDSTEQQLQKLFQGSIEVSYSKSINLSACTECAETGGLCYGGTHLYTNDPCLYPQSEQNNTSGLIIGIACVVFGGTTLLLSVLIIYCGQRKTIYGSFLLSQTVSSYHKDVDAFIKQYGSSIPQRFRYSTIRRITNSFKDELGKGGYGIVYRGSLPDGRDVAVKVLNATKGNGEEFINEVASIGRTSHVNVVTLLGFCYEGKRRALIYEFMPNGSLEKFIYGTSSLLEGQHLGWEKLFNIAIGIARGLEYLHRGCNTRILHFDIKPHNILLDRDFHPKISDFGLAKLYTTNESAVSSLLQARGTIGYIAPEVFSRNFGQVSHKSDVYSYGMMILEMIGGRKNVDARADHTSEIYYPRWLYKRIQSDDVLNLANEISVEENELVRKMVIVGLWCIQIYPSHRPSISKVIEMLEGQIAALEIPPSPYLCSVPSSPSNFQTKLVLCPPGTESTSSKLSL